MIVSTFCCKECVSRNYVVGIRNTTNSKCIACESGIVLGISASSDCNTCNSGYASGPDSLKCSLCESGEYWLVERYECQPCSVFAYKTHVGLSQCQNA